MQRVAFLFAHSLLLLLLLLLPGASATAETARSVQLLESLECFAQFESGAALWRAIDLATPARFTEDVDLFAEALAQIVAKLRAGRWACDALAEVLWRGGSGSALDTAQNFQAHCVARLHDTPWAMVGGSVPITHPLLLCLHAAQKTGHSMMLMSAAEEAQLTADALLREAAHADSGESS